MIKQLFDMGYVAVCDKCGKDIIVECDFLDETISLGTIPRIDDEFICEECKK